MIILVTRVFLCSPGHYNHFLALSFFVRLFERMRNHTRIKLSWLQGRGTLGVRGVRIIFFVYYYRGGCKQVNKEIEGSDMTSSSFNRKKRTCSIIDTLRIWRHYIRFLLKATTKSAPGWQQISS